MSVTFTANSGGKFLNGQGSISATTDLTGHTETRYFTSTTGGIETITATFTGNQHLPVVFNATGLLRNLNTKTTFSGIVLSNSESAIIGAHCVLTVGGQTLAVVDSDANGQFAFNDIPSGVGSLLIDASGPVADYGGPYPPGSYPNLKFTVIVTPNAANGLGTPVILPPLLPENARKYDGTQDVVLTCDGVEGLKLIVKAGSMRNVDGSIPSAANPATLSLNQVHFDKIPRPIPDGSTTPFSGTVQPAGSTFDPPIQLEFPNFSAMPPGAVSNFYSFNYDSGKFEVVATMHVSDDGKVLISDPGTGMPKGAWFGGGPPPVPTGDLAGHVCDLRILSINDYIIPDPDSHCNIIKYQCNPITTKALSLNVRDNTGAIVRSFSGLPTTEIGVYGWNAAGLTASGSPYKLELVGQTDFGLCIGTGSSVSNVVDWNMKIKIMDLPKKSESLVSGPNPDSIKNNLSIRVSLDGGPEKNVAFTVTEPIDLGDSVAVFVKPSYRFYTSSSGSCTKYKVILEQRTQKRDVGAGLAVDTVVDGALNAWDMDPIKPGRQTKGTLEFSIDSGGRRVNSTEIYEP